MPQTELPREVARLSLTFGELIETLGQIEGSIVIASAPPSLDAAGPSLSTVGAFRRAPQPVRADVHAFWIGEPGRQLGGHLRLSEATFRKATLTTFDGNDYFIIHIGLDGQNIMLQDEASGSP